MKDEKLTIAIVTPTRTAWLGAGDWVQAYNTGKALRDLGHEVFHFLWGENDENLSWPGVVHIKEIDTIPTDVDIIHFLPPPPNATTYFKNLFERNRRPLLVASTIFWDSLTHRQICAKNSHDKLVVFKYFFQKFFPFLSRSYNRFFDYDLLLPNSFSEIQNVENYFKISRKTSFGSVPNGITRPHERARHCPVPKDLEKDNYIIYPGVFSPRKNQLGFIKAMKDTGYKVVFMGGPVPNRDGIEYLEQCKKEAPDSYLFLGQVENGTDIFYGVLRGARIACLASSCETPGIALIEAASQGARPVMTKEGSGLEYFGFDSEYFNPLNDEQIVSSVTRAWKRGRLTTRDTEKYRSMTWKRAGRFTEFHYKLALQRKIERGKK